MPRQLCVTSPAAAFPRGGTDLETIRRNRNNLAHGHERFSDVGAQVTVNDLKETYHRSSIFMKAVLRALDAYVQKKKYIRPKQSKARKATLPPDGASP
jgi:hypothetical protein